MKSAYSADKTDKYAALLDKGYLRYVDKERALMWASAEGDSILQLLTTALRHSGSGIILKKNMPFVNTIFSASMEKASLQALDVLRTRADEREGERLMKHPMLYVNTAKAHKWLVDGGLQLPTVPNLIAGSKKRVLTPTDLVKYKFANRLSFSLSGLSILDKAATGKMAGEDKMIRLLNYARKEAARWARTFGKDRPNARAAEAMGTVSSIRPVYTRSCHRSLGRGWRGTCGM